MDAGKNAGKGVKDTAVHAEARGCGGQDKTYQQPDELLSFFLFHGGSSCVVMEMNWKILPYPL